MIVAINPASGSVISTYHTHSPAQVEERLAQAADAQSLWAERPLADRCAALIRLAAVLRARRDDYARLIVGEMGKPLVEAEAEIEKSALTCEFYAEQAPHFLADASVASAAADSRVVYDPLGVVLAVMPWNYPFWQFVRFAAPALAAGNGAILKHASNVPGCALALEQAFAEADLPTGLVATLLIEAREVAGVLADPRIAAVTLTGSTAAGQQVASQAGALMKKQVLELGGSDPFLVLADADVALAAQTAVKARFGNAGQSCISAKRFIVAEAVADAFTEAFATAAASLRLGDPLERATQIGPLARAGLREDLQRQVTLSLAEGARLVLGGTPLPGPGFFYPPTVLDQVTPEMTVAREETFGPVAAIIRVADEDEAIRVANASQFGLGAALWTRDLAKAQRLARRLEAGAVFINAPVASDPRVPFGGIKQSGYGRELGEWGIREFTNVKTVWQGAQA
ncbi:NAD-dependent succinate-semialdehyde dehydrogenase [Pseudomonas oryzihabitans]|uniref:NADP-dependent succinic semialdehyde dehydrogenase n=1 Tax=Pseudomonas oryzihabitans TaxID=47885 RepID=A0A2Z5A7J5_9PSED|nr:NAD-dependent succinate-semialdehyde dehydrogenase [Pseudomonas oryzihabitans]AXA66818.1 NADP-dependent succinic semialdehyde dehydrogenase [Pseudomonas oryzihabitans]